MNLKISFTSRFQNIICYGFIGVLLFLFSYLVWVAAILRVDNFDAFGLFLNARQILFGYEFPYYYRSTPFLSLLYALFLFIENITRIQYLQLLLSRIAEVAFFIGAVCGVYRLFRFQLSRFWAVFGITLFALNPLLIHSAPFPKEDIVGVFLLVMAFVYYLKWKKTTRGLFFWISILWAGVGIATRHNFMALMPGIFFLTEIWEFFITGKNIRAFPVKNIFVISLYAVLATLIAVIFPTLAYGISGRTSWTFAPILFFAETFSHMRILNSYQETWWEGYAFIWKSFGGLASVLAMIGVAASFRKQSFHSRFFIVWIFLWFLFHGHFMQHKEARFFFPIYPAIYFFVIVGIIKIKTFEADFFKRKILKPIYPITVFIVVCILGISFVRAGREMLKFQDPFYHSTFVQDAADYAKSINEGGKRLVWAGDYYPAHPKEYFFHSEDEATYLFHVYTNAVRFYSGMSVSLFEETKPEDAETSQAPIFLERLAYAIEDGQVVFTHNEKTKNTRDVSRDVGPLVVERARIKKFSKINENDKCIFLEPSGGGAERAVICAEGRDLFVRGVGFFDAPMEILFHTESGDGVRVKQWPRNGQFEISLKINKPISVKTIREARVLFFDRTKRFSPSK